ncbi:MAG TPA: hypothetical protein PKE27_11010 [Povalibacter sp.]|uniref:hypothetical protein n=1 Tax=Povalibacter sp. TaxID=1962978 RepID=UPI002BED11CB|nr:hypothetical protein [Povalibacter sp.]HMN45097.1 hypothetical protein [Povalibacter sp.]
MAAAQTVNHALGSQFVAASAAAPRRAGSVWLTRVIVFTPVVFATLLAKFTLPGLNIPSIGMLFPMVIIAVAAGLATGRLQPVPMRLALFLLMLSVLALIQIWRGEVFSLPSLAMMAVLGFAYVPAARRGTVTQEDALRFFCNLTALIALAGVIQFTLQFVGGKAFAFPIETFVPDWLRTRGYNDIAPLYYGAKIYKATGFVMLEPSVFCQLCALGLTAELVHRNRGWRMAAYAAGIVVSYSGTGLLILAVTLPVLVILYQRWDLLLRGLLLLAVLALLVEPLNLNVTLNRASEFSSSGGSSAFIRFVGWMNLFADKLWTDPARALFGYGAGTFFSAAEVYRAGEMAHAKIFFEFGVVGGLLYFVFLFYCFLSSRAPLALRIGVLAAYFMNGAYSPSVTGIATSLLLWPALPVATQSRARQLPGEPEVADAK